jgi:ArsR family transcriptional regulator, arsenate/arsenite/antimonite-responsive transcriptional repressor
MAGQSEQPINQLQEQLTTALQASLEQGDEQQPIIGHFGVIQVEGKYQRWWSIRYNHAVSKLLTNPDYKVAQILSVLGSEVRLAILRRLLDGPQTVAEIVAALDLKTTGQAYHHIRELERAGYIKQREGGKYHFDMARGRVYLSALALAADAGAEEPEESES